jgi:hypothetical protein
MSDHASMIFLLSTIGAVAVGALALRYGAESRPGFDERREPAAHRPWL